MVKIIHNKILGGWYIVRGPHHTPIGGRFDTKAEAQAHLGRRGGMVEALADLNTQIEAGREFPDIIDRTARKHGVSEKSLTRAYDNQF